MNKFQKKKISDFGTVITGKTPPTSSPEDFNGDVLFVTPPDFKTGKHIYKTERTVSDMGARKLSQKVLGKGSVMVTCIGEIGKVAMATSPTITNQQINSITINTEKYSPDYIYYVFKNSKKYLDNNAGHTVLPILGKTEFEKIELPIIEDKIAQEDIAFMLSSLDSKIELNNKINAELESMAKAIYDYWFVQFDFPDEDGKPYKSSGGKMVWNEELKREIPEGWRVRMIKDVSSVIMGQSPRGESYNRKGLGVPLLNGPADYDDNQSLFARTYTTEPTRLCKKDDLIFCIRATIGKLTFAEKEFCLGRGLAGVRSNDRKLSELLFFSLLQEIERFKIHATGSIIVGITKEDLTDSYFLEPPPHITDQFHGIEKPIFDSQRRRKIENQELSNLRDWLLPMLMNGQVTVSK